MLDMAPQSIFCWTIGLNFPLQTDWASRTPFAITLLSLYLITILMMFGTSSCQNLLFSAQMLLRKLFNFLGRLLLRMHKYELIQYMAISPLSWHIFISGRLSQLCIGQLDGLAIFCIINCDLEGDP